MKSLFVACFLAMTLICSGCAGSMKQGSLPSAAPNPNNANAAPIDQTNFDSDQAPPDLRTVSITIGATSTIPGTKVQIVAKMPHGAHQFYHLAAYATGSDGHRYPLFDNSDRGADHSPLVHVMPDNVWLHLKELQDEHGDTYWYNAYWKRVPTRVGIEVIDGKKVEYEQLLVPFGGQKAIDSGTVAWGHIKPKGKAVTWRLRAWVSSPANMGDEIRGQGLYDYSGDSATYIADYGEYLIHVAAIEPQDPTKPATGFWLDVLRYKP